MKNKVILFITVILSGCYAPPPLKIGLEGKLMPSFNLLLMDSTSLLNTSAIPTGNPTVFLLFSPSCHYCRAQTQDIIDEIKSLTNIRFYIFSSFSFDQVKSYNEHYQLNKYKNITVGQDYGSYFENYFKAPGVPYMAIYSKDKRLKQVFVGKVEINEIKQIALE